MARLQQEIENLKADRAPGGGEKVKSLKESSNPEGCYDLDREQISRELTGRTGWKGQIPLTGSSAHIFLNWLQHDFVRFFILLLSLPSGG